MARYQSPLEEDEALVESTDTDAVLSPILTRKTVYIRIMSLTVNDFIACVLDR